jgi:hypothetical protein
MATAGNGGSRSLAERRKKTRTVLFHFTAETTASLWKK